LGKYLASTDKKTRDKAIKNLSTFLSDSSQDAIPESEMAKLWKGIFYCFWMSDKPLVQQALASELAELILTITNTPSSLAFLRGFWETTVREWSGIDRLRIDKYYMLVRRFVNATFRLLMRTEWVDATIREYNDILIKPGGPLCPSDIRVPTSLAYHLADIYLEELDKAVASSRLASPLPAPLSTLFFPFFNLAARTSNNTTYKRVQSALLDPLFDALKPVHSDRPEDFPNILRNACLSNPHTEGAMDSVMLRKVLLRQLFEVASDQHTRDSNRRKLYVFWKDNAEDTDEEDSAMV